MHIVKMTVPTYTEAPTWRRKGQYLVCTCTHHSEHMNGLCDLHIIKSFLCVRARIVQFRLLAGHTYSHEGEQKKKPSPK